MNAIVLSSRQPQPAPDDRGLNVGMPANDDRLTAVGAIFGPEEALDVTFSGISPTEAERALASFPGARRCVLAQV